MIGDVRKAANAPLRNALVRGQEQQDEKERNQFQKETLRNAKRGMRADQIAALEVKRQKAIAVGKTFGKDVIHARDASIEQLGKFLAVGERHQQVDFSGPQEDLRQMFGHGEKIWGTNNQPVVIHNDLNSSRADPFDETSSLFGFGNQAERSGLF